MVKILLGGSPCTYWSVARKSGREIQPSGMGWELFLNYKIAKDVFRPDFFLYENNESAAEAIKDQIAEELKAELFHGNSQDVSAQQRRRIYAFNWKCDQPQDRGITLKDVIRSRSFWDSFSPDCSPVGIGYRNRRESDGKLYRRFETSGLEKANALTTVETDSMIAEPLRHKDAQRPKVSEVFRVQDGIYQLKGKKYNIALPDGEYIFRHYTQTEAERLQTLPEGYTKIASRTAARKALGNGWTAEMIIHILKAGLSGIDRAEPITVLSMYVGIATGRYCLEKLGFKNIKYYAYEIDPMAIKIALSNYPDIIQMGDAFQIREPGRGAGQYGSQPLLRPAT